jgi:hypothetical protein
MNVAELTDAEAFDKGADLWIVKNDPQSKWWQELDLRSGFLLSRCLSHHRKPMGSKVNQILEITEFPRPTSIGESENLLIGTADHFLNKWILLWQNDPNIVDNSIEEMTKTMNFKSVRLFSDAETFLKKWKARPKSSLDDITFIKNT